MLSVMGKSYTPETKGSSMEWCAKDERTPEKTKTRFYVGKVLTTAFLNAFVYVEFFT